VGADGYSIGSTHCTYKASTGVSVWGGQAATTSADPAVLAREGAWTLTPVVQRALKGWSPPADAPVHKLGGGSGGGGSGGGGSGGGGGGGCGGGSGCGGCGEEVPSEDEEDVEPGTEMAGMAFACIGTLNPPTAEIAAIVGEHGGTFVSGAVGDGSLITHLIASEAEVRKPKGKRAQKYSAALDGGVPIVSCASPFHRRTRTPTPAHARARPRTPKPAHTQARAHPPPRAPTPAHTHARALARAPHVRTRAISSVRVRLVCQRGLRARSRWAASRWAASRWAAGRGGD
jgi:hypothetical protein